jgi:hypothetical protein
LAFLDRKFGAVRICKVAIGIESVGRGKESWVLRVNPDVL